MSEYQYYEFQAIDRPLTTKEQAEIKKLSSRVRLTPTHAIFLYNYGDFRGDAKKVLTQYFDMMFYIANWGTWQLMFRLPKAIANVTWFRPYEIDHTITVSTTAEYIILDIHITQEDGLRGWVEGEGWLPRLVALRDDLLRGDLRLLYLVWLRSAPDLSGYALDDDPVEPPIPPNLGQLSDPLQAFIELVELDWDLVTAAAEASPRQPAIAETPLEDLLSELSAEEQQEFLLKLLRREPHVDLQLINRLKELAGTAQLSPSLTLGFRRFSELDARADHLQEEREQKAKKTARTKRIQELEALALQEAQIWEKVVELIALKQAKPYDEATALLKDLRDLAEYQGRSPEFLQRFETLKANYQNRPGLMTRLRTITG